MIFMTEIQIFGIIVKQYLISNYFYIKNEEEWGFTYICIKTNKCLVFLNKKIE